MFAHVVTAQAEAEGFDSLTRLAREQLPAVRQQPGFRGFYLLRDPESDKLMTISLWETKEDMQAGEAQVAQSAGHAAPDAVAAGDAAAGAPVTGVRADMYEVTMSS